MSDIKAVFFAVSAFVLGWGAAHAQEPTSPKDAILILDASGSMWGQIDGVNKIVIAKDVTEGLVRSLPAQQRLGLIAYGHRKKGDCSDIETLAGVGGARGDLITQIRALSPKGKTPLSKSVEHAANELNYTKNAATVILVSDGLENCDVDPCAMARMLEEKGLDFTVHVVGFDVTSQERKGLQCIAEETGGDFLAAANAEELTDALGQVAAAGGAPAPTNAPIDKPQTVALKATILRNGPDIQSKLNWSVTNAGDGMPVFLKNNTGYAETLIVPGTYVAKAVWTGWRDGTLKSGEVTFTIKPQQPKVVSVPIDLGLPVTLEAPEETPEGTAFDVTWSGPDDLGAYIHVNRLDDGPRDAIYFLNANKARNAYAKATKDQSTLDTTGDGTFNHADKATASIGAPTIAGDYEIRYILDDPRLVLARVPLTVTDNTYSLDVPTQVGASMPIEVNWEGPLTPGDFVTLSKAGDTTVFQRGSTARLAEGKPATLTAAAEPGDYEIRYIMANGYTTYPGMMYAVQASVPITIIDVSASVSGPSSAVGGSTISVAVTPADGWEDDFISIIEKGSDKANRASNERLSRAEQPGRSVDIRVPEIAGDYEIAYFLVPGSRVIAREPIKITQATASVEAPETVKVGEPFKVQYSGDAFAGDRVVAVKADTPDSKMWSATPRYGFLAESGGGEGEISGYPISTPGVYEVRYVTGKQHVVLARQKIVAQE